jgi:hypothetical protein
MNSSRMPQHSHILQNPLPIHNPKFTKPQMGLNKPKCWLQIPNLKQHTQALNESAHELSRKILHKAHIKSHIQQ